MVRNLIFLKVAMSILEWLPFGSPENLGNTIIQTATSRRFPIFKRKSKKFSYLSSECVILVSVGLDVFSYKTKK